MQPDIHSSHATPVLAEPIPPGRRQGDAAGGDFLGFESVFGAVDGAGHAGGQPAVAKLPPGGQVAAAADAGLIPSAAVPVPPAGPDLQALAGRAANGDAWDGTLRPRAPRQAGLVAEAVPTRPGPAPAAYRAAGIQPPPLQPPQQPGLQDRPPDPAPGSPVATPGAAAVTDSDNPIRPGQGAGPANPDAAAGPRGASGGDGSTAAMVTGGRGVGRAARLAVAPFRQAAPAGPDFRAGTGAAPPPGVREPETGFRVALPAVAQGASVRGPLSATAAAQVLRGSGGLGRPAAGAAAPAPPGDLRPATRPDVPHASELWPGVADPAAPADDRPPRSGHGPLNPDSRPRPPETRHDLRIAADVRRDPAAPEPDTPRQVARGSAPQSPPVTTETPRPEMPATVTHRQPYGIGRDAMGTAPQSPPVMAETPRPEMLAPGARREPDAPPAAGPRPDRTPSRRSPGPAGNVPMSGDPSPPQAPVSRREAAPPPRARAASSPETPPTAGDGDRTRSPDPTSRTGPLPQGTGAPAVDFSGQRWFAAVVNPDNHAAIPAAPPPSDGAPAGAAPSPGSAVPARPEVPGPALQMVAEAVRRPFDGTLEIRLAPEELGRVRVAMTETPSGLLVSISADRPDTLDLLRRHADILAADLRQQGHESLSFAFGEQRAGRWPGGDDPPAGKDPSPGVEPDATGVAAARLAGSEPVPGRLDLRM